MLKYLIHIKYHILFATVLCLSAANVSAQDSDVEVPSDEAVLLNAIKDKLKETTSDDETHSSSVSTTANGEKVTLDNIRLEKLVDTPTTQKVLTTSSPSNTQPEQETPIDDDDFSDLDPDLETELDTIAQPDKPLPDESQNSGTTEPTLLDVMKKNSEGLVDISSGDVKSSVLVDKIENKIETKTPKIIIQKRKLRSLMYDPEEEQKINHALESLRSGVDYLPQDAEEEEEEEEVIVNRKSYINLASILYFGEGQWALWINGEKFTSDSNSPDNELYIESVDVDKIKVLWTISASKWRILLGRKADGQESKVNINNQVEARFELKPNQTYLLVDDKVVEGNVRN